MRQVRNIPAALGLRPLTARSVIASVLLSMHPPELPAAVLVQLGDRFGIAPGTTRVALSRMASAGELAADDGDYRLVAETHLARQRVQDEARRPPWTAWNGDWRVAVVVGGGRSAAERAEVRRAFGRLRFGLLREGVWLRPANLPPPAPPPLAEDRCRWLLARPEEDPVALAAGLWDLVGWTRRAQELLGVAPEDPGELTRSDRAAAMRVFATAAALLRHLRTDPLLPAELLPPGWPAGEMRRRYAAHARRIEDLIRALAVEEPGAPRRSLGARPTRRTRS